MSAAVCPECHQGKHPNCTGLALNDQDEFGPCDCQAADHDQCCHCGEPRLDKTACVDGLNHCHDCRHACTICRREDS